MKTHPLVDDEKEHIVLPLLRQVGSAHENQAFIGPISPQPEKFPPISTINRNVQQQVISISFHQINFSPGSNFRRKIFPFCKPKPRKQIVHNITGGFSPGMNAILGPSGCGKSTLLDILADRKDPNGLTGRVLVGGRPRSKTYKYSIGYVVQEDIISGTLTVRENLMFSANVRLQRSKSTNERTNLVNKILQDLSLEKCADSRIGTHLIRGISGGEKRRACIGMELVLSPKILFLDEPTSGLDASTAETVMKCLYNLSRQGCTIIFSIHQPRYSIYKLFDCLLLLSSGDLIYLGEPTDLLGYFSSHGFHCNEHENPTDFVLDVLIECHQNNTISVLQNAYLQSQMKSKIENLIHHEEKSVANSPDEILIRSYLDEFYYVCIRTLRNTMRDPSMVGSQIIVSIFLALLTGLVFNQIQATVENGIQNRLGVIFFIVVNQVYSTTTALEPLVQERALFIHENASGFYRVSTFFLAKLICDIIPMRLIPSILFCLITYFLIGFQATVDRFFVYLLTIFLSTTFGSSICFLVASAIPIFVVSLIIVVFIFVIMMVFSGFLIDLASVAGYLRWIQWFSAFRYATNLVTINEFRNLTFCLTNNSQICPITGEQILTQRQIPYENQWDVWQNLVALIVMSAGFLLMALIQLLTMKKVK